MGKIIEMAVIDYDRIGRETDLAILLVITDDGHRLTEAWIPRSQILELDEKARQVTIPDWLATEKGLT